MDAMYVYKGYDEGVEFCKQLKAAFDELGEEIRIMAVAKDSVPECPYVIGTGHLSQSAMALLMANELDVFVDPARVHSYGLPALEALFSGCGAITFGNKGEKEYANWFRDKLFTSDNISECVEWVMKYERPEVRKGFTMEEHADLRRSHKVNEFVRCLCPPPEKQFKTRIEVVTPHLRKHGGPTTNIALANTLQNIGHNVSMSMIYTDWNPEVFNMAKIPLRIKWKKMPSDAKVIIINSDNPFAYRIMDANPDKKYVMYKLSHNERFHQSENDNLNLGWDHIITSTQWLKDACMAPEEGWDHVAWPDEKVTVVGWYHYGHDNFSMPPQNRTYGDATSGFRIGTLVHEHPLKGTEQALIAIDGLKKKWEGSMHAVGFGEAKARMPWHWQYLRSVPRPEMAHVMAQLDIWYGASFTEGLGRMSLEAMSAGCAVITTDTGAEHMRHEENCLLYPVGEAQAGADLVDRLVQDRDLMQKLVLNGYDTAKKSADPSGFSHKVNSVIREVLDEG
jgi:glycosyltransferase involved in cell wall biosynthesis